MEENTAASGTEAKTTVGPAVIQTEGLFNQTLKRNNSKIKQDRAEAIGEEAELIYKRTVEDIEVKLKQLVREASNLLDMSPDNTMSLILASDFKAQSWVDLDLKISLRIRDEEIKLGIAKARYVQLFGVK